MDQRENRINNKKLCLESQEIRETIDQLSEDEDLTSNDKESISSDDDLASIHSVDIFEEYELNGVLNPDEIANLATSTDQSAFNETNTSSPENIFNEESVQVENLAAYNENTKHIDVNDDSAATATGRNGEYTPYEGTNNSQYKLTLDESDEENINSSDYSSDSDVDKSTNLPNPEIPSSSKYVKPSIKGGRKCNPVWESFLTKRSEMGKILSNICLNCRHPVSAQAPRMRAHISKCSQNTKKSTAVVTEKSVLSNDAATANKSRTQQSIKKFFPKINTKENEVISQQLGRFLFSSNLSFNILENKEFKKFVACLNPAYTVPSHEAMGSTILDVIYKEVNLSMQKALIGGKGVLLQDGWSTNQNEQVISHCLTTGTKSYFLMSENPGTKSADADCCYKLLRKAINKAKEDFNCEIVGVVTDNCSTMAAMQKLVRNNQEQIEAYGCNAHLFNLLGKHFTPSDLQKSVNEVQSYMKNHFFTTASLKNMKAVRPVLPGSTRWNSQIDSFINYMENQSKYLEVSRKIKVPKNQKDQHKLQEVKTILEDSTIYPKIKKCIDILSPIAKALDKAQSDKTTLADSTHSWVKLQRELPDEIVNSEYFQKQLKLGLTPVAAAAYLLHPKYKGSGLNTVSKQEGLNWLSKIDNHFIKFPAELEKAESEYIFSSFLNEKVCEDMHPRDWWKAAATNAVPSKFMELMTTLFIFPPSTGSIERSFSTLGNIMSKQRNRLKLDKASKLCTIYNHFRLEQQTFDRQENTTRKAKKRKYLDDT